MDETYLVHMWSVIDQYRKELCELQNKLDHWKETIYFLHGYLDSLFLPTDKCPTHLAYIKTVVKNCVQGPMVKSAE